MKFFASVRMEVRRLSKTDGGDIIDPETKLHTGHRMRLVNKKNKVGPPFRETVIELDYATGIDTKGDKIQYALNLGLIEKTKQGRYIYKGENYLKKDLTDSTVFVTLQIEARKGTTP